MSAQTTETEVDVQGIAGDAEGAAVGIEFGAELMRFGEAVAQRDAGSMHAARQTLLDRAGPSALVEAAGVAANFQRMVRIADSIGIPVDDMNSELGRSVRTELALDRFASARNTPGASA